MRQAADTLLAEGRPDEALDYFTTALADVLHRNTELELLLAKLRRHQLGKSSEKITAEQLALLLEGLQQLEGEAEPIRSRKLKKTRSSSGRSSWLKRPSVKTVRGTGRASATGRRAAWSARSTT